MIRLCIKEVAEMKGLNKSQLQRRSGVTVPLLNRYWRNETSEVKLEALEAIARTLGVAPGELLVVVEEEK